MATTLSVNSSGEFSAGTCTPFGGPFDSTFHPLTLDWVGLIFDDSSSDIVEIVVCKNKRPLRVKQRDDYFNAPRTRHAPNNPTSIQDSMRSSRSGNYYA